MYTRRGPLKLIEAGAQMIALPNWRAVVTVIAGAYQGYRTYLT